MDEGEEAEEEEKAEPSLNSIAHLILIDLIGLSNFHIQFSLQVRTLYVSFSQECSKF